MGLEKGAVQILDGPVLSATLALFLACYCGMALGRLPFLALDRAGIALLCALGMIVVGAVSPDQAAGLIDLKTVLILFVLMLVSAQAELSGLYGAAVRGMARLKLSPPALLGLVVAVCGALSMVLINDIVVYAMIPPLVRIARDRDLPAAPFVLAVALSANAGSAATLIGNPQNVLLGQSFGLDFLGYMAVALPPALGALTLGWAVIVWRYRADLNRAAPKGRDAGGASPDIAPALVGAGVVKLALVLAVLVATLLSPLDRMVGLALVAAVVLLSRRHATGVILARVDWSLLLLFVGLFIVTGALAQTGVAARALAWLGQDGMAGELAILAAIGSNTIGNVPLVVLLIGIGAIAAEQAAALAVYSTLAGNLLLVGSIANLIAVERAHAEGVTVGFLEHARVGVPVGALSLGLAWAWFTAIG